jgi:hypothetical protein
MQRALTAGSTRTLGRRAWWLAALAVAAFVVPALTTGVARAETTWLCKPGLAENPCESSEETTVELGDGSSSVEQSQPASNPPIDCFYVYPTVSGQSTENANLEIEPEERQVAIDQASRFSQQCKVYAPIYPQITRHALENPAGVPQEAAVTAYIGVVEAFERYLAKYNKGRGFVLLGHSQGALMLKQLIKDQIDPNAALRNQLVSAVLLGANVLVPKGGTVGGDFQNVPACQSAGQTHCIVAYSSFLTEPPEGADFGRVSSPLLGPATSEQLANDEVLCVNPALAVQGAGSGALLRYEATTAIPGFPFPVPSAATPWVSMPGQYTGQCDHANGASWLQLNDVGPEGDPRAKLAEVLGPLWGTHLNDVNVALGNLVGMIALQSATYHAERVAAEPPVSTESSLPTTSLLPTAPASPPATSVPAVSPPSPTTTHGAPASHKKSCRPPAGRRANHKRRLACSKHKRPAPKHRRR